MKKFFFGSFLRTAILLIAIAALPAFASVLLTEAERRAGYIAQAEDQALEAVGAAAQAQRMIAAEATIQLATLSLSGNLDCSPAFLREFVSGLNEGYSARGDVFVVLEDGQAISSGVEPERRIMVPDRSYFTQAMQKGGLVSGGVTASRFDRQPALYFGYRFTCSNGRPAVLASGIRPASHARLLRSLSLAPGEHLFLADMSGKVLFALGGGQPEIPRDILDGLSGNSESAGLFYLAGQEGRQAVAFERISLPGTDSPYMQAVYVLPEASLLAGDRFYFLRAILFLVIALAAMAWVTALLVRGAVSLPLRRLLAAARRYGRGEYDEKVILPHACREFVGLGDALNTMADALRKREQDLIAARESAESAVTSKSEFLANISHEVRTPMNAIIGMAYLALKENLSPQQRGYLMKIHDAGSSLLNIINDILELSRLDAGKLAVENIAFDLEDLLARLRGRYLPQAEKKGLTLRFDLPPDLPRQVSGDPLRLEQILVNLLDNALHFTSQGGIRLACVFQEAEDLRLQARIDVLNTGESIPEHQIRTLREIFAGDSRILPKSMSGAASKGFGLALSNRLARLMGGELRVQSEPGREVVFSLFLPLALQSRERRREQALLRGARALAVDGNKEDLDTVSSFLRNFGLEVSCGDAPKAALKQVADADASGRPFDLVVLTWRMPGMDGLEMTRQIRGELPLSRPPLVIMLSPYAWKGSDVLAEQAGVSAFLHKPVNESVLLDSLMNLFRARLTARQEPAAGGEPSPPSLEGARVLVVEDNEVNRQIAEEILSEAGLRVTLAPDGQTALDLLEPGAAESPFDFVLMDVQMPGMDGLEATRRLRALPAPWAADLPIIAMTAHNRGEGLDPLLEAGMDDHAAKPIDVEDLLATLKRWLPPRAVADPGRAAGLRSLHDLLRRQDAAAPAAAGEAREILNACLLPGRAERLLARVRSGRLREAAALLERADTALHFLSKDPA
ncbi:MAG: response regulator [Desulfovibrio sp.]|jgi:signal transduction histidine kinase/CheY-like chemotaxis protein|nr:response regulator [Desulfovibrio sp.]